MMMMMMIRFGSGAVLSDCGVMLSHFTPCCSDRTVSASQTSIQSALDDFPPEIGDPSTLIRYIVDGPGSESYPLAILSLINLEANYTTATCSGENLFMNIMLWAYANTAVQQAVWQTGYTVITSTWLTPVIDQLTKVVCNGRPLMQLTLLSGSGPYAQFFSSWAFFYTQTESNVLSTYTASETAYSQLLSNTANYFCSVSIDEATAEQNPQLSITCLLVPPRSSSAPPLMDAMVF